MGSHDHGRHARGRRTSRPTRRPARTRGGAAIVRRMSEDFPAARVVTLPDRGFGPIEMAVHDMGEGPAVVLSHGFPELAYSWRHQLPALAAAGFHAVAPDQRGYGATT